MFLLEKQVFYISSRVDGVKFFDHFWMGRFLPSQAVFYFTSYTYMKDYCHEVYPEPPSNATALFYDNCALAHVNEKGSIDPIPHAMYGSFENQETSRTIRTYHRNASDLLMLTGIVLHLLSKRIDRTYFLWFIFITNMLMSVCELFEIVMRYGMDYNAYIQQAGAVYNGETDYTKLSSHLGPCYYPAGHIWHYIPAYWLHL